MAGPETIHHELNHCKSCIAQLKYKTNYNFGTTGHRLKVFCHIKVGQLNGKFNSNQFSLLNFLSMSSGSKVTVDFVSELA